MTYRDYRRTALVAWCLGRWRLPYIETGAKEGETFAFWSQIAVRAVGCDIDVAAVDVARRRGLNVMLADSTIFLESLRLDCPAFFMLDAVSPQGCGPLLADLEVIARRWPAHVVLANSITIDGQSQFLGRKADPITARALAAHVEGRYRQILVPRHTVDTPTAGYALLSSMPEPIPFDPNDFDDLAELTPVTRALLEKIP